jgi:hypothetical protein
MCKKQERKQLWKVIYTGGHEFRIYTEYDDYEKQECPIYPNFAINPEYTNAGNPFTTAGTENCAFSQPGDCGDCGGCNWFHIDEAHAIIGVCMCVSRKQQDAASEQNKT